MFGGTAEYVALWLKNQGHEPLFYWYVAGCIFVSLLTTIFLLDTRRSALDGPNGAARATEAA
jgi:MHS family alpha-ketoglutarate permease-like MFS transporter